jgi:hypothetical protein
MEPPRWWWAWDVQEAGEATGAAQPPCSGCPVPWVCPQYPCPFSETTAFSLFSPAVMSLLCVLSLINSGHPLLSSHFPYQNLFAFHLDFREHSSSTGRQSWPQIRNFIYILSLFASVGMEIWHHMLGAGPLTVGPGDTEAHKTGSCLAEWRRGTDRYNFTQHVGEELGPSWRVGGGGSKEDSVVSTSFQHCNVEQGASHIEEP